MLTKTQKDYLASMSLDKANKLVKIEPYNPKTKLVAKVVMRRIKDVIPSAHLKFMGASALGISGLNDVDIWVFCSTKSRKDYLKKLVELFDSKIGNKDSWKIVEDGVSVSIKLCDPKDLNIKGHLVHFDLFKKDPLLLKSYENLKSEMNGKTYKEYATAKKDFLMRAYFSNTVENRKNLKFLEKIGAAVTNSHVVIPSGRHARTSFTKYKLYPHVKETFFVAKKIAQYFQKEKIDAVIGLAIGGDILAELVAYYLQSLAKRKIWSFYMKKDGGNFVFRDKSNKGWIKDKKVLIVDDTLDTCHTAKQSIKFISSLGAQVVGFGTVCTRNGLIAEDLGLKKFYTFINNEDKVYSYNSKNCPMCEKGMPINLEFGINS